jgi:hypothetical protein
MRSRLIFMSFAVFLLLVASCESPPGAAVGVLRLITHTTGGDPDLDGYVVTVDHIDHAIAATGSVAIPDLATGSHEVSLGGIAANCTPFASTQMGVVRSRDTTDVTFTVACVATGVRVTANTDGLDFDSTGYVITVDGVVAGPLAANASRDVTRLTAGSHVVTLSGVDANCGISGTNPRSVDVVAGAVAPLIFNVTCTAKTGVVEVSVTTTGVDLDPNGYMAQIDSGIRVSLATNGTVRFTGLTAGLHQIHLSGLSSNCAASSNLSDVVVTVGSTVRDTARTSFSVSCVTNTSSIQIIATTSGSELDSDGYVIAVDQSCDYYYSCTGQWNGTVASNGEVTFAGVPAGQHWVTISGIVKNCALTGANPRSVNVEVGATASVTLAVTCAQSATVTVTVATGGVDPDQDGYWVTLTGPLGETQHVAANGSVSFDTMPAGDYQVLLVGAAFNCASPQPNPRSLTVLGGGATSLSLDVTCALARQLAFVSATNGPGEIYRVKSNGTDMIRLTVNSATDDEPAWSPDGSKIAFTSLRDAGNSEIYVMNADGSNQVRLTNDPAADAHPSWSPDGSKIAFVSDRGGHVDIYAMHADGTNPVQLTNDGATPTPKGDPAWSGQGTIAFWRTVAGEKNIWAMDADGSNPRAVTTNGNNSQPAWSPDGTRLTYRHIAACDEFTCSDFLYIVNADGSGNAAVTSDVNRPAVDGDWSPEGAWIAFGAQLCYSSYYGYGLECYETGLEAVQPDGSGRTQILSGPYGSPAWRPGAN